MEYLSFNPQGQWTLHKAYNEPPKNEADPNKRPFKSFSAATAAGQLHEDRGQKGVLHDFGGGKRPKPKHKRNPENWGKPSHNVNSVYEDQNPGVGE